MGVLNVTPDSFFDGGRWFDPGAAIGRGLEMISEGADVIDVGGESTRPGATPVEEAEERRRVLPVIAALAPHIRVSVDTRKPRVAAAAVAAGASLINDVSATLWPVAAAAKVGWVAMHMQGEPATMQVSPTYRDVVGEVRQFLADAATTAELAGVEEIWVDPGIGFGKTMAHNLQVLRNLDQLVSIGRPLLVGTSRKSFLGRLAVGPGEPPAPLDQRLAGSLAAAVWCMVHEVAMVRVHDVAATALAARLVGGTIAA